MHVLNKEKGYIMQGFIFILLLFYHFFYTNLTFGVSCKKAN